MDRADAVMVALCAESAALLRQDRFDCERAGVEDFADDHDVPDGMAARHERLDRQCRFVRRFLRQPVTVVCAGANLLGKADQAALREAGHRIEILPPDTDLFSLAARARDFRTGLVWLLGRPPNKPLLALQGGLAALAERPGCAACVVAVRESQGGGGAFAAFHRAIVRVAALRDLPRRGDPAIALAHHLMRAGGACRLRRRRDAAGATDVLSRLLRLRLRVAGRPGAIDGFRGYGVRAALRCPGFARPQLSGPLDVEAGSSVPWLRPRMPLEPVRVAVFVRSDAEGAHVFEAVRRVANHGLPFVFAVFGRLPACADEFSDVVATVESSDAAGVAAALRVFHPHVVWMPCSVARADDAALSAALALRAPLLAVDAPVERAALAGRPLTWFAPAATGPGACLRALDRVSPLSGA